MSAKCDKEKTLRTLGDLITALKDLDTVEVEAAIFSHNCALHNQVALCDKAKAKVADSDVLRDQIQGLLGELKNELGQCLA